jgi:hypothetical protein
MTANMSDGARMYMLPPCFRCFGTIRCSIPVVMHIARQVLKWGLGVWHWFGTEPVQVHVASPAVAPRQHGHGGEQQRWAAAVRDFIAYEHENAPGPATKSDKTKLLCYTIYGIADAQSDGADRWTVTSAPSDLQGAVHSVRAGLQQSPSLRETKPEQWH